MKIKDYSVIETEWIENRISIYEGFLINSQDSNKIDIHQTLIEELKEIKSKLKPLIPIVENAFDKSISIFQENGYGTFTGGVELNEEIYENEKQDYINNTIIE
jgi:hypothetical protein